jgi:hypothetical protein
MYTSISLTAILNHQRKQQKKDVAKMTHSIKVRDSFYVEIEIAKLEQLQERLEFLDSEVTSLKVELRRTRENKNFKKFMTERKSIIKEVMVDDFYIN